MELKKIQCWLNGLPLCVKPYHSEETTGLAEEFGRDLFSPYYTNSWSCVSSILLKEHNHIKNVDGLSTICDAGCGHGQILYKLQCFFDAVDAIGIEISPKTVRESKEIVKYLDLKSIEFKCESILDHDFKNYSLIYSYHPARCGNLQKKFDEHILNTMRRGAHYLRLYNTYRLQDFSLDINKKYKQKTPSLSYYSIYTRIE